MKERNQFIAYTKWLGKWLAIIIGVFVLLVILIVSASELNDYLTYDLPKGKIEVTVQVDSIGKEDAKDSDVWCDSNDYPVFIGFINGSKRTIEAIDFTVRARQPGYSSNVTTYYSYSTDKIIAPGEGWGQCVHIFLNKENEFRNPRELEYEVKISHVDFKN